MEQVGATTLSVVTYLNPIVATVLGVILLGEQLGWSAYGGYSLILLGTLAINGDLPLPRRRKSGRLWGPASVRA